MLLVPYQRQIRGPITATSTAATATVPSGLHSRFQIGTSLDVPADVCNASAFANEFRTFTVLKQIRVPELPQWASRQDAWGAGLLSSLQKMLQLVQQPDGHLLFFKNLRNQNRSTSRSRPRKPSNRLYLSRARAPFRSRKENHRAYRAHDIKTRQHVTKGEQVAKHLEGIAATWLSSTEGRNCRNANGAKGLYARWRQKNMHSFNLSALFQFREWE